MQSEVLQNISVDAAAAAYFKNKNEENLETVIYASAKLVGYFVKIYGKNHSQQDLIQAGNEGVMKALKRFDPGRGVAFATYAGNLIAGEIRHCICKENAYYQPKTIERLQEKIDSVIMEHISKTGDAPSMMEISRKLNIREDGVSEVMKGGLVSIHEIDFSKIANIRAETFKLPIEDKLILEQAIKRLSELQQKVVHMIFYRDMTQNQAATELGINQRKVSRELAKSLEQIRKLLA